MSSLSQFVGGSRPPRAIINVFSTNGSAQANINSAFPNTGCKVVASGACIAATLKTVLSLSGSGVVNFFGASGIDATARTHRLKCTVDGVVVFDSTTASSASANFGLMLVGFMNNSGVPLFYDQIPYSASFLVEYASSLGETDKTNFAYLYRTN